MKSLSTEEANAYLANVGMRIGDWCEITDIEGDAQSSSWVNYHAPQNSHELLCFAQHAAGWVPNGTWKILQIDNSTGLDAVQDNFIGRLVYGPQHVGGLGGARTLLFEFGKSRAHDLNSELLLCDLIFAFLLFEAHGYLVSSNSYDGMRLGLQDGFAYFIGRDEVVERAKAVIGDFKTKPRGSPRWVTDILSDCAT